MASMQPTLNIYNEDIGAWLLCDAYMHYCDEGGKITPGEWNIIVNQQVAAL